HVHRVNGLFEQAEAHYREALELAGETANAAAEGKALTDLVQTLAWRRPHDAQDLQPRALELNEALRNQVEIVKIRAASAVALTNTGNLSEASDQVDSGLTLAEQCGYPGGLVWCWVARTLNDLRRGDNSAGRRSAARLAAIVGDLQGNRFWSEIANWWTEDDTSPHADSSTRWLEGEAAARTRWLAVLSPGDHGPAEPAG
nr:hypothetical protein [Actinomycetota bacterium]